MADFAKFTSGFNVGGVNVGIQPAKITTDVTDERVLSGTEKIGDTGVENKLATSEQIVTYVTGRDATLTAKAASELTDTVTIKLEGDATGEATFQSAGDVATITVDVPYSGISGFGVDTLTPSSASTTTGFAGAAATEKALQSILDTVGKITSFKVVTSTDEMTEKNIIYLIKTTSLKSDNYEEYIVTEDGTPTKIGETTVDLSDVDTLKAASANWDKAYEYVTAASGDIEIISGYAVDWNTFKTDSLPDLTASANSGAAASAWLEENMDTLTATIQTDGYVSGNGTESAKISLTNVAADAIDAVTGAVTTSAGMADTANADKLAQVGAITGYIEDKISETIAETIDIAETITTDTPISAIPNVGALTGYIEDKDYIQSGFVAAKVFGSPDSSEGTTYATTGKDTIAFSAGKNITLNATADANGNPTIVINSDDPEKVTLPQISGFNGVSATAVTATDGTITEYHVSGVVATTADYGVTKASYYDDSDKLIHLF